MTRPMPDFTEASTPGASHPTDKWDEYESPQEVTYQEAILEGADPTEGFYE